MRHDQTGREGRGHRGGGGGTAGPESMGCLSADRNYQTTFTGGGGGGEEGRQNSQLPSQKRHCPSLKDLKLTKAHIFTSCNSKRFAQPVIMPTLHECQNSEQQTQEAARRTGAGCPVAKGHSANQLFCDKEVCLPAIL